MNPTNRKSTRPGLAQQSPARQAGRPPQIKPAVAQPNRPQAATRAAQPKMAGGAMKGGAWQKPSPAQLAQLYYDLTKGQNLSEANHRGSYLALQAVASAFEVYAPSADILGAKSQFMKGYLPWFQEPKK